MFTKSARFYDEIYAWKDYEVEALRLKAAIAAHKTSPGNELLDVACGTGGHIPYLRNVFNIEGLDLDPEMLDIARSKHPDVQFHHGDMADFDLGRQFDIVASLFSSIAYMVTPERMAQAVRTMARHVRPGGLLIIEPFFAPEAWKPRDRAPGMDIVNEPEIKIVRMLEWARESDVVQLTFHYLVGDAQKVVHFTEDHKMGLFSDAEHRAAFAEIGMTVAHDEDGLMGRGLYIGKWDAPAG